MQRSMGMRSLLAIVLFCVGSSGCQSQSDAPPSTMSAGEQVFQLNCAVCHTLQGTDPRSFATLIPAASPMGSSTAFIAFLRNTGIEGMPSFHPDELSDADANTLYTWLKATYPPAEQAH